MEVIGASCPCFSNPAQTASSTHKIGGWVGPRAGLDGVEKRKTFPCWYHDSLVLSLYSSHYTD